jgi:hypothetical protein
MHVWRGIHISTFPLLAPLITMPHCHRLEHTNRQTRVHAHPHNRNVEDAGPQPAQSFRHSPTPPTTPTTPPPHLSPPNTHMHTCMQGMTVAAIEAELLDSMIAARLATTARQGAAGSSPRQLLAGLGSQHARESAAVIADAWCVNVCWTSCVYLPRSLQWASQPCVFSCYRLGFIHQPNVLLAVRQAPHQPERNVCVPP